MAGSVTPPAGLVAWWRGENNALDSAGTNHGTALNGTSYAPGIVGQAFTFDGFNDAVLVPDAPAMRPTSFTLEGWVMFGAANGTRVIFAKQLSGRRSLMPSTRGAPIRLPLLPGVDFTERHFIAVRKPDPDFHDPHYPIGNLNSFGFRQLTRGDKNADGIHLLRYIPMAADIPLGRFCDMGLGLPRA